MQNFFADDTSTLSVVHNVNTSAKQSNDESKKLMIELSNEKGVSILIRVNKLKRLFTVVNQRNRHICLWFSTIAMSLKQFLKNTKVLY